jgi:hypothetical protein
MDRSPLQQERRRRGWTQEHVADELVRLGVEHGHGNLGIDGNAVSRHERGIVVMPRDPYPVLYAALYGTTVDALWPAMIEGVERRGFLRALAAAPVASMLPAGLDVTTQAGTAAQAGEVIAYLRRIFPEFSTADWLLGCQAVLPVMPRHLAAVEQLLPDVTGRNRTELLKVGARYGEFCSWLHQDAGDMRAASLWADRAIEWGTEADDQTMVAYTLARKAHQAAGPATPPGRSGSRRPRGDTQQPHGCGRPPCSRRPTGTRWPATSAHRSACSTRPRSWLAVPMGSRGQAAT